MKIVFSSRNKNKIKEIKVLLSEKFDFDIDVLSLDDIGYEGEIIEDGKSFEENAMIKAKAAYEKSGLPSFADDSGLEVDALGGEPGIYSARYASKNGFDANDEDNNALLLKNLKGKSDRSARYVSVIAYCDGKNEIYARGTCEGEILESPVGTSGFGYDPIFLSKDLNKTFASVELSEKNKISHRKRAFDSFAEKLKEIL